MNMRNSYLAYLFLGIVASLSLTGSGQSYVKLSGATLNMVFHSENEKRFGTNIDIKPFLVPVHSWYPRECCLDIDCAPVDAKAVRRTATGWYVVDSKETIGFLDHRVKHSLDGQIHRCVEEFWEPSSKTRCLLIPESGMS